jgi:hypothetical protein
MNATFTAYAASDLYHAGYTEDGRSFVAEVYYVVMENDAGRRFRHEASFAGTEVLVDDEGICHFPDLREQASAKAERLAARVNAALSAGQGVDLDRWEEVDPAYGSDEYVSQGTEAKRAFEECCVG